MACYDPESDPYASTCEYPYDPAVEQLCDLGVDEYGSDSRYSIPYDDGAGCPMYCDVLCGDDEEACYDYDSYGCQAAPYCVPMGECYMTYDYYGCPIYEPVEPNDDEMVCTGAYYNVSFTLTTRRDFESYEHSKFKKKKCDIYMVF